MCKQKEETTEKNWGIWTDSSSGWTSSLAASPACLLSPADTHFTCHISLRAPYFFMSQGLVHVAPQDTLCHGFHLACFIILWDSTQASPFRERSLPINSRLDKVASLVTSDFLVHFSFNKLCIGCSPVLCELLLRVDLWVIYLYTPRTEHCTQYIVVSLKTLVGIKMDRTNMENIRTPGLFCECLYNISKEKKEVELVREVM